MKSEDITTGHEGEHSETPMASKSVSPSDTKPPDQASSRLRQHLRNLTLGKKKISDKNPSTMESSRRFSGWPFRLCSRKDSTSSSDIKNSSTSNSPTPSKSDSYDESIESPSNDSLLKNDDRNSVEAVMVDNESPSTSSLLPTPALEDQVPQQNLLNQLVRPYRPLLNTPAGSRSPGHGGVQFRVAELVMALRNHHAVSPYPYLPRLGGGDGASGHPVPDISVPASMMNCICLRVGNDHVFTGSLGQAFHSQADFIHFLVPDILQISNSSYYWGKMDRYEAEKLLENRPEGTFLLRDSAQEEHLFSVSFRRFDRSLHARIEQLNHRFSFDSHDPGVFSSPSVCGLVEHYKDPSHCMFFEPMLTTPLHRNFPFSLEYLTRATICSRLTYDGIDRLPLPKRLANSLKEYHYKQKVRERVVDPLGC